MVKKTLQLAFIGLRADNGESGHEVEGSIRLKGMLWRDCKHSLLHNSYFYPATDKPAGISFLFNR